MPLTNFVRAANERRVKVALVESDVVQKDVRSAEGDETIESDLFLLRVTEDATTELLIVLC